MCLKMQVRLKYNFSFECIAGESSQNLQKQKTHKYYLLMLKITELLVLRLYF